MLCSPTEAPIIASDAEIGTASNGRAGSRVRESLRRLQRTLGARPRVDMPAPSGTPPAFLVRPEPSIVALATGSGRQRLGFARCRRVGVCGSSDPSDVVGVWGRAVAGAEPDSPGTAGLSDAPVIDRSGRRCTRTDSDRSDGRNRMTLADQRFRRDLRAARRGDQDALRRLWGSHAGPITGFLVARGTPEADEVVNDVFVAAFDQLGRFSGTEDEFRSWLFGIARNKRIDQLRRHGRRPSTTPLDDADQASIDAVEDQALRAVGDSDLVNVLQALTADQRDVIVLRFIADLSLDQTAVALDKPVGAVKALQHRALAQLREKFRDNPYPPTVPPAM